MTMMACDRAVASWDKANKDFRNVCNGGRMGVWAYGTLGLASKQVAGQRGLMC